MRPWRPPATLASPSRQRGQALIWLIGVMSASVAVLYGVYNYTQLTVGKEKTINAADSAALAGSTVEARLLNLMAYNNRSMVANETTLVQFVSIESWVAWVGSTADHIGEVLDAIPFLEEVGVIVGEAGSVADSVHDGLDEGVGVAIRAAEVLKTILGGVHLAIRNSGDLVALDAANKVVAANRAQFNDHVDAGLALDTSAPVLFLTTTKNHTAWRAFTSQYVGSNRVYAAQVVNDSRDEFTTSREGNWFTNFEEPLTHLAGLEKHGGSQLKSYDRWETEDTEELWGRSPFSKHKHYLQVGWGRADMTADSSSGTVWDPRRGAQYAALSARTNHTEWTGIPKLYDVADLNAADRATLGINFTVVVTRAKTANLTTSQIGMQKIAGTRVAGSSEMNERLQNDRLAAIGRARVFFERPQAGLGDWTGAALVRTVDHAKEYGSLYSPFWQARLTPVSDADKSVLYAAISGPATGALARFTP